MKNAPTTQNKAERGVAWWAGQDFTEFGTNSLDWWPAVVELIAGPNHGLKIGVIDDAGFDVVEIIGTLPQPLRKGLHRYAHCHHRDYAIEWVPRHDGKGARYELNGLGDFLNRLAERRALMQGGAK